MSLPGAGQIFITERTELRQAVIYADQTGVGPLKRLEGLKISRVFPGLAEMENFDMIWSILAIIGRAWRNLFVQV